MTDKILNIALHLGAQDIKVFPLRSDLQPKTVRGSQVATADPQRIERLHMRVGFDAIGVPLQDNGLVAVRIANSETGRAWWSANGRRLPSTRSHRLPGGERELLFSSGKNQLLASSIAGGVTAHRDFTVWPVEACDVLCPDQVAPVPEWLVFIQAFSEEFKAFPSKLAAATNPHRALLRAIRDAREAPRRRFSICAFSVPDDADLPGCCAPFVSAAATRGVSEDEAWEIVRAAMSGCISRWD